MPNEDKRRRIDRALKTLSSHETDCALCPRRCRINRKAGRTGICQTGTLASVSHALLHFGEEPVLSGKSDRGSDNSRSSARPAQGSGTIFFSGCNLKCVFCQNYQLSWLNEGTPVTDEGLAEMMLGLQCRGALNINFVSPSHVVLPILRALQIACEKGLHIPLVFNSNGYDRPEVVGRLDGIMDIYLPDIKYISAQISNKYSGAADYFEYAGPVVREMSLQQPVLSLSPEGTALKGLIIRHLVIPGYTEETIQILRWIKTHLSPFIGLSLMSQYHPCYKAPEEIRRSLSRAEYRKVIECAFELGFENLYIQPEPFAEGEHLIPDFDKNKPFKWKE